MLFHEKLGSSLSEIRENVRRMIGAGQIKLGGNKRLKIYGKLDCASGKKMKMENRVLFSSVEDALSSGYRPCGYCMRDEYAKWKEIMNKNEKRTQSSPY